MSFNVRHANISAAGARHPDPVEFQWPTSRGPAAVGYVRRADPDIIGFQEVEHRMKGINGRSIAGDMITTLVKGLPGYTFTKVPQINNFLPIAFKTNKFVLEGSGRIQIQFKSDAYSDSNRFSTWAILRRKSDHQRLLVANVWANDGASRRMALGRAQGWQRLLPALAEISNGYAIPTILVGDFNAHAAAQSYPYDAHLTMFAADGWLDASHAPENLQTLPGASSYDSWGRKIDGVRYPNSIRLGDRIDYIWTNGGAAATTWQIFLPPFHYREVQGQQIPFVDGTIASDHWPVLADIALDGTATQGHAPLTGTGRVAA
jgi:endonuclease/exonuclease/phosphatase family metal-dependent hydrolase